MVVSASENIQGIFVSEIYEVLDCIKYDTGIDGTATNIYTLTNMTRTPTPSYTLFEETQSSNAYAKITDIPFDTIIEFDIYCPDGTTNNAIFNLAKTSINYYGKGISYYGMELETWYTLRITVKSDKSIVVENLTNPTTNTDTYTDADTTSNFGFWFARPGPGTKLQVRNVKIYPI